MRHVLAKCVAFATGRLQHVSTPATVKPPSLGSQYERMSTAALLASRIMLAGVPRYAQSGHGQNSCPAGSSRKAPSGSAMQV